MIPALTKLTRLAALGVLVPTVVLAPPASVLGAASALTASAGSAGQVNLVLVGGAGPDEIHISLSADGHTYMIDSATTLESGGGPCTTHPVIPTSWIAKQLLYPASPTTAARATMKLSSPATFRYR